jgi:hypothetical protein
VRDMGMSLNTARFDGPTKKGESWKQSIYNQSGCSLVGWSYRIKYTLGSIDMNIIIQQEWYIA